METVCLISQSLHNTKQSSPVQTLLPAYSPPLPATPPVASNSPSCQHTRPVTSILPRLPAYSPDYHRSPPITCIVPLLPEYSPGYQHTLPVTWISPITCIVHCAPDVPDLVSWREQSWNPEVTQLHDAIGVLAHENNILKLMRRVGLH